MQINKADGQSFGSYVVLPSTESIIKRKCNYRSVKLFYDMLNQRYTDSFTDIVINNNAKNGKLFAIFSVNKGDYHSFKIIDQGFKNCEKFLNRVLKTAQKMEDKAKKVLD